MKIICLLLLSSLVVMTTAEEPAVLTLATVPDAVKITSEFPLRETFSSERAARYLDIAALDWTQSRECATCHTTMPYLMARPALSKHPDSGEVRDFYESYWTVRWKQGAKEPSGDTLFPSAKTAARAHKPLVVGTGLAFNDAQTTGKLAEATRQTLDRMWQTQGKDGAWTWPVCGWAPMEVDKHFGVTLAAVTTGIAPDGYAKTDAAVAGLDKVRAWLDKNPPKSLHHRMMIAWAGVRLEGFMDEDTRQATLKECLSLQGKDGGWSTAALLADWKGYKRIDGKPHDTETSDAYGTGFSIVLARELGLPADHPNLQRGIRWLQQNQRENGMWFSRSPAKDSRHYFTNTGTAYAVLALQSCGELPGWPF